MLEKTLYVGLDVHKARISVTVAEQGRGGAGAPAAHIDCPPSGTGIGHFEFPL